jgi:hypothetical protein
MSLVMNKYNVWLHNLHCCYISATLCCQICKSHPSNKPSTHTMEPLQEPQTIYSDFANVNDSNNNQPFIGHNQQPHTPPEHNNQAYQPPPIQGEPYEYKYENQSPPQYQPQQYQPYTGDSRDQGEEQTAMFLFFLSFFFGGVILQAFVFIAYRNSHSPGARRWAKISGIFAVIILLFSCGSGLLLSGIFIIRAIVLAIRVAKSKK